MPRPAPRVAPATTATRPDNAFELIVSSAARMIAPTRAGLATDKALTRRAAVRSSRRAMNPRIDRSAPAATIVAAWLLAAVATAQSPARLTVKEVTVFKNGYG